MNLKSILEFKIIDTDSYDLTLYHIAVVIFLLLITKILLLFIRRIFKRQETKGRMEIGRSRAIFQFVKYFIWTMAILLSLETFEIKITFLLASSAALLVGLGLGLQQIFQDFVSGIALMIEGTLKVSDVVEIESGEVGKVIEIGVRTSKLETRDNIIIIVPNSKLINDNVINWSHIDKKTRFSIEVGVAYGSDVRLVEKLLIEAADSNKEVFKTPQPTVRFSDFGDSSLDFRLLFFTNRTFRVEDVRSDIRFKIDELFRKHNVHIPFPQRDVHLIQK